MNIIALTTEYANNPLGIDQERPRFGWQLQSPLRGQKQSAFRVLVASSDQKLADEYGDMWDSGRLESNQSVHIVYLGAALQSGKRYYWKVMVWDGNNQPSEWSNTHWWEMGLLQASNWQGNWIGSNQTPAPLLRKEFILQQPVIHARLYISGLAYYEAHLNGNRVGDHLLDPGFTRYDKRVLYAVHDITNHLRIGANCIGVELGRGFYGLTTPNAWGWEKTPWNNDPKVRLQLNITFADGSTGSVYSDGSWQAASGPTVSDSIFCGEVYDARLEKPGWTLPGYAAGNWEYVVKYEQLPVLVRAQVAPPMKIIGTHHPVSIHNPKPGHFVFEMEYVMVGWIELNVSGPAGTKVTLIYGEKLRGDGTVDNDQGLIYEPIQTDVYILKGEGTEVWQPKFSYKGFQYVEIVGYPGVPNLDSLVAKMVHSAVSTVGSFSCSNLMFNQIHEATRKTILHNLHSIPTDTPVHEKQGWLGDAQLMTETMLYNYDMVLFFEKWLNDIRDSQNDKGLVQVVSPATDWGVHSPEWNCAYILIPWLLYQYYGDQSILQEHYASLKLYVDNEISLLNHFIADSRLGDWLSPGYTGNPEEDSLLYNPPEGMHLTATAYVYLVVETMSKIALVLGNREANQEYEEVCERIKEEFNKRFLDVSSSTYHTEKNVGYRQTSNLVPLALGMTPPPFIEEIIQKLIADIMEFREGHLHTGIIGTKFILPVLTDHGYGDVAYTVANQRTYPGWGFWMEQGYKTLPETWGLGSRSHNHYMFGTIDEWFYQYLAGIKPLMPGYELIQIKPYFLGDLTSANAIIHTVRGIVSSGWTINEDKTFELHITIPANTEAIIYVPAGGHTAITESGISADQSNGVRYLGSEKDYVMFRIGSGTYVFKSVRV